jgi:hypothetical protein
LTAYATADDIQHLPRVLRLVASAGGIAAALRLVEKRGGIRVYVPEVALPGHELATIASFAGMQALCSEFPREHVLVPKARSALVVMRNRQLLADSLEMSHSQLARRYEITLRRVQQILAEGMVEGCGQLGNQTPDLFS